MKYGEYIKTREARALADSDIRKLINMYTAKRTQRVLKIKRGAQGTLDYGKAVILMTQIIPPETKKLLPSLKPSITVLRVDYSLISKRYSKNVIEQKFYVNLKAAEKQYKYWTANL